MSTTEKLLEDFVAFTAASKEFIGEFIYAPFGVESSPALNSFTLYAIIGLAVALILRASIPAPKPRHRHQVNQYDYGRNV